MRALLLLTSLLLPAADEIAPPPFLPLPDTVSATDFKALLGDNLRLRKQVMDALEQRDAARDAMQTCVVARSA